MSSFTANQYLSGNSGVSKVPLSAFPIGHQTASEIRKPGQAFGTVLRCWNCGAQIGEKQGAHFLVSSNKVEVGGIGLVASVWRRCRGGRNNPACRSINTLPVEWLTDAPKLN